MDLDLKDSVSLVVGGASGIGRACAEGFLSEGGRVVIWDISEPEIFRSDCTAMRVDISDPDDVAGMLAKTETIFGPIDHLVHAAAVGSGKFGFPFTNLSPQDWQRVLDVNISGMVNVAHEIAPAMQQRGRGSMVFVASVAGQIGSPTDPPYTASKAANISFAQIMARDLAADGIRVNTVCPGMVRTPLNRSVWQSWCDRQPEDKRLTYDEWADQKIRQLIPLGTWQTAEDIANMILFLSSAKASQVTGQTINVDGGYVMHW